MLKHCPKCEITKKTSEFGSNVSKKDGLSSYCSDCIRHYSTEWKSNNRSKVRWGDKYRQSLKKYGVTKEQYQDMLRLQNHKCPICLSGLDPFDGTKNCHIDHCHKTGMVRGILCFKCNVALGGFNDNLDTLRRAADYLSV